MSRTYTDEQTKIIYCDSPLILVSARPGSGKTSTLLGRINRLVNEGNSNILVVTFSNKAVEDITARLNMDTTDKVTIKTIHALGYQLVKKHWGLLGNLAGDTYWPERPRLVGKLEELQLIDKVFPGKPTETLYDSFIRLRLFNVTPQQALSFQAKGGYLGTSKTDELKEWSYYENQRLTKGLLTFDDMVGLANRLMCFPQVSVEFLQRYPHILVDEAQDTDWEQWKLLIPLIHNSTSALLVFDENQSIYGWRGAYPAFLQTLANSKRGIDFKLTQTFRCGPEIAAFANDLCPDKSAKIITKSKERAVVIKSQFDTRVDEVDSVMKAVDAQSAIISRTNSYLELFERILLERNIPYQGAGFYKADHVVEIYRTIKELTEENLTIQQIEKVVRKMYIDNTDLEAVNRGDCEKLLDIYLESGYEYLTKIMQNAMNQSNTGVWLGTGHASKGLEWPTVFLVGCHKDHIPHAYATDLAEEKRLLYVMVTRAAKRLSISWVGTCSSLLVDNET